MSRAILALLFGLLLCTAAATQGPNRPKTERWGLNHRALRVLDRFEHYPFYNVTRLIPGDAHTPIQDPDGQHVIGPLGRPVAYQMPLIAALLLLVGGILTIRFRGTPLRLLFRAFRARSDRPRQPGELRASHALWTALAATVGMQNIAGAAIAVAIGGPGAVLWMVIGGLICTSLQFAEATLAHHFRRVDADGTVTGGPMIYLRDGLAGTRFAILGTPLALAFGVLCIGAALAGGGAYQANLTLGVLRAEVPFLADHGWTYGLAMAVAVGLIVAGGYRRITSTAGRIVPVLCLVYLFGCSLVLAAHVGELPGAISSILGSAFSSDAIYGGALGTLLAGTKMAVLTNSAGYGHASIAHAPAHNSCAAAQGLLAQVGPIVHTVLIATVTGLVIVVTGVFAPDGPQASLIQAQDGLGLASSAFASVPVLSSWFPSTLTALVVAFTLTSCIAWAHFGERCWVGIFGERSSLIFRAAFVACTFAGTVTDANHVLRFGTLFLALMAFPNALGLLLMQGTVSRELRSFAASNKTG